jgi:TatD DNase family protein
MIDSHCHLDIAAFDADRNEVIARANAAGVVGMLVPAIRPTTWDKLATVAVHYASQGVRVAYGVHPQIVPELTANELALASSVDALCDAITKCNLASMANGAMPMVAVGECGLDGGTANTETQELLFRVQLRVARQLRLPAVVHVLRAHHRAPQILREEKISDVGGIMHSYSGGSDLIAVYQDLGMAFSFAGPVTYPGSRRPLAAAKHVSLELLLVETDSPDQKPVPAPTTKPASKAGRCEPADVVHVVAAIAAARSMSVQQLTDKTTSNLRRILPAWV